MVSNVSSFEDGRKWNDLKSSLAILLPDFARIL